MTQRVSAPPHQDKTFVSATKGGDLILKCIPDPDSPRIHWYKQSLGQKSKLMCSWLYKRKDVIFYNEFEKNPRFSLDTDKHHLTISNVSLSDSGFYYCVGWKQVSILLDRIIYVNVMRSDLKMPPLILQSKSKPDQPKDSVILNCTVHTWSCGEEHIVYWFRHLFTPREAAMISVRGMTKQKCASTLCQWRVCLFLILGPTIVLLPHVDTLSLETGPSWKSTVSRSFSALFSFLIIH